MDQNPKKVTRGGGREQNNFFFKSLYSATTWIDQFHFLQDINDVMCVMKTRFHIKAYTVEIALDKKHFVKMSRGGERERNKKIFKSLYSAT